jgi:putative DNA primase/helicase
MEFKDKNLFTVIEKVGERLETAEADLIIDNIKDVKEKEIIWIWKNVISRNKITLIAGEPGVGKSQLLLYIASIVSNGGKFHYASQPIEAAKVLLICGEDNVDDTIKPRLMALNANLDNVKHVRGIRKFDSRGNEYFDAICLIDNLVELESEIKDKGYGLIIVDPISVYLNSVDENKNKEIRSALAQLTALIERTNTSLIINSHFSKPSSSGSSKSAINRIMGSIGTVAAARVVWGVMKDPEEPKRRLFIPIKNNIGDDSSGFVYTIKQCIVSEKIATSRIEWLPEKVEKTANEIMNQSNENRTAPQTEKAKEFLLDLLKDGPVFLTEIRRKAQELDITVTRLYAAKEVLKIQEITSLVRGKGKMWMLPDCTS